MDKILNLIPEAELEELQFIENLLRDRGGDQVQNFVNVYRVRRRSPQVILLTALAGFIGVAGIHRFVLNQPGMGILYFFTGGLCLIGTIVDLVKHKTLTLEYNQKTAVQVNSLIQ